MNLYRYYKRYYDGDYEEYIVKADGLEEALEKVKRYKVSKGGFRDTIRESNMQIIEFTLDDVCEF